MLGEDVAIGDGGDLGLTTRTTPRGPLSEAWETLLPDTRGRLPSGDPLYRTEPDGNFSALLGLLGVYPAARVAQVVVAGKRMNLPVQVERRSFEEGVSASARDLDSLYLGPLGLTRSDVLIMDMMPYFLANTRKTNGRCMADNIADYERMTGAQLLIPPRPSAPSLVRLANTMPGNVERLQSYLGRSRIQMMWTLGLEAAAFARAEEYGSVKRRQRALLYQAPTPLTVLGANVNVVHLAHPGILMTKQGADWLNTHKTWCVTAGRDLAKTILVESP